MKHDPYSGDHSAEYGTPRAFFERVHNVWRFSVDVCATADNSKIPTRYFCPPGTLGKNPNAIDEDGLEQDWMVRGGGRCWMNPPYSRGVIDKWIAKAVSEAKIGCIVIALLPAASDTIWYHDLVVPNARIVPVRGRIKFIGAKHPAKLGSILAEFLPPWYGTGGNGVPRQGPR